MQSGSQKSKWHFDILLADGFVLSELAAITDPLRVCNRTVPVSPFTWTYRSNKGGIRRSPAGVFVETEDLSRFPDADFLFVVGNADTDHPELSVAPLVHQYTHRGAKAYLLAEAATRYIAQEHAPLQMATHWENANLLREKQGTFESGTSLAVDSGKVVTCAGMSATTDVVLALIGDLLGKAVQVNVANVMLHESVRDFGTLQPGQDAVAHATGDRELDRCIALMHQHIEDPLSIAEINERLNTSPRGLERKFQTHVKTTPGAFYRKIRLHRANNLLLNTTMSVIDIGVACGFSNGFSSQYKKAFGVSPMQFRKKGTSLNV